MPRVDVVLATNRSSPFLVETLRSVQAQTFTDWTLTVVDDGSPAPDAWRRSVDEIPRARVIRQAAAGLSVARNTGLAQGRGEFVVFLDDDDVWRPDRLAEQIAALDLTPAAVACHTGGVFIDSHGETFGIGWHAVPLTSNDLLAGTALLPRIVTLMVRRTTAEELGGFNPVCRIAEDQDFMMRLAAMGNIAAVDLPLVRYRRHSANASQPGLLLARQETRAYLWRQVAQLRGDGRGEQADLLQRNAQKQRRIWAEEGCRAIRDALRRRDWRGLRDELAWGLRWHPVALALSALLAAAGRGGRSTPTG